MLYPMVARFPSPSIHTQVVVRIQPQQYLCICTSLIVTVYPTVSMHSIFRYKRIIIALVISLSMIGFAYTVRALTPPPFGGRIISVFPCACSGTLLVKIGPPVPGVFVFQPGVTKLYQYFQLHPPVWTLGLFAPGLGVCLEPCPTGC